MSTIPADLNRQILRLAVPSLGALVAEPLFVLADSAIVGRLGTTALAGLAAAAAVLSTTVSLCVFLAYGTTAAVARHVGAGAPRRALAVGVDGCWLAAGLGAGLAVLGELTAAPLVHAIGARGEVAHQALGYLHTGLPGLPGMLVVLAATGVLRGRADARTPLRVATTGALVNIPVNWLLVYPLGLGVTGSGLGTAMVQVGMAAALLNPIRREARRLGVPLRPDRHGVLQAARTGTPLLIRTLALQAGLLATTMTATRLGDTGLAAHQVAISVWTFLALALDAIAIAAQTLTGTALGAGDTALARAILTRLTRWGIGFGVLSGVILYAGHALLPGLFTADPAVRDAIGVALAAAALGQPVAGYVFVLDGVLMGAGDGRYLALASILALAGYLPVLLLITHHWHGIGPLWIAFAIAYPAWRALTLAWRQRQGGWTKLTPAG